MMYSANYLKNRQLLIVGTLSRVTTIFPLKILINLIFTVKSLCIPIFCSTFAPKFVFLNKNTKNKQLYVEKQTLFG